MDTIEQQRNYLLGLERNPSVTQVWGVDSYNLAEQYIVGTDDHGTIMWAPHHKRHLIGTKLEDLAADVEKLEKCDGQ